MTAICERQSQVVMVGVFSIFATLQFMFLKQFGVGLAVAVLVAATIVRAAASADPDEASRQLELVPAEVARVAVPPRAQRRPRNGGARALDPTRTRPIA
jgi:hypothetical protein